MCLGIAALALTAGCEGITTYTTEAAATNACGDDEVVMALLNKEGPSYVTKASAWYGRPPESQTGLYACLAEMIRFKVPCGGKFHNVDEGPRPTLAPSCSNVPEKPKA
jgi:hypothetical protein